jgi:hypothetical protein
MPRLPPLPHFEKRGIFCCLSRVCNGYEIKNIDFFPRAVKSGNGSLRRATFNRLVRLSLKVAECPHANSETASKALELRKERLAFSTWIVPHKSLKQVESQEEVFAGTRYARVRRALSCTCKRNAPRWREAHFNKRSLETSDSRQLKVTITQVPICLCSILLSLNI